MKNNKKKSARTKKEKDVAPTPSPAPLSAVLRAIAREQNRALIFENVAEYVNKTFGISETRTDPKKVLQLPDGTRRPADFVDVVEIVQELQRTAYDARARMRRLREAGVLVEPDALPGDDIPHGPQPPPPSGEGVVDAGGVLAGDTAEGRRWRQTEGLRRRP